MTRSAANFNCRVLHYERGRLPAAQERFLAVEYAELDRLLGASDIVASFLPYSESTIKLLGKNEIALIKPGAIFVNAGRGPTVDEEALIDALRENRIAGAGLDVFTVEPLPISSPLTKLDNVVLAPHSAGGIQGWMNTFERIAENLRRVEAGEAVMFPMTPNDPQPGDS